MRRRNRSRKRSRSRLLYCGNNKLDIDLVSGRKVKGNRYTCMKVGIGKGLNMQHDPKYNNLYEPIDKTRVYCGLNILPYDYDRYGTVMECLQKGIGIGKSIKAKKYRSRKLSKRKRRRSK